ncbi:Clp protease [Caldibacillus phage CBP1]|uniref:ATP-dependent Clp protease proteolytic subunit n=1 Tax=Caldibacillus debilis GB1 TaxID=1339248 RepID=A0A420VJN4_9BACI|nr:head maturation protease, ClpP-related [Caldibacillus debilis]ATB52728.1 Clp protease [Caldibacillus phage CBP1]RKO63553.1 Protease subunit of ATP-dependent Clp protease [Caldibacillus debilis GB1]
MAKLKIKGTIVSDDVKWIYELFGIDATSPKDIEKIINEANGEDLEVEINSGGGYVDAGSEIYTMLKKYPGKVQVDIMGIAASAASVIAMAGDPVRISPTAQIMIHNVSSIAKGDYHAMEHEAEVLKNFNKAIANAYMLKTGLSQEELLQLMDKETWLNAQQAKEYGFVDEILFDEGEQLGQLVASYNGTIVLPPEVINKVRNLFQDINTQDVVIPEHRHKIVWPKQNNDAEKKNDFYQARLRFLKLKGELINE